MPSYYVPKQQNAKVKQALKTGAPNLTQITSQRDRLQNAIEVVPQRLSAIGKKIIRLLLNFRINLAHGHNYWIAKLHCLRSALWYSESKIYLGRGDAQDKSWTPKYLLIPIINCLFPSAQKPDAQ
ncbi:hypothetical protein PN36_10185 [Candidatus Thiomargarita nelsonii]|uniref:Transposase n=1 Tax=Candidatus Thiomargarita nelsonii TaxID=1003181 RepID=A0A0A6PB49_9GAMM|nr:hypothetical protein PN36_10185 [Candidatus Thiomargarita nelsonii]